MKGHNINVRSTEQLGAQIPSLERTIKRTACLVGALALILLNVGLNASAEACKEQSLQAYIDLSKNNGDCLEKDYKFSNFSYVQGEGGLDPGKITVVPGETNGVRPVLAVAGPWAPGDGEKSEIQYSAKAGEKSPPVVSIGLEALAQLAFKDNLDARVKLIICPGTTIWAANCQNQKTVEVHLEKSGCLNRTYCRAGNSVELAGPVTEIAIRATGIRVVAGELASFVTYINLKPPAQGNVSDDDATELQDALAAKCSDLTVPVFQGFYGSKDFVFNLAVAQGNGECNKLQNGCGINPKTLVCGQDGTGAWYCTGSVNNKVFTTYQQYSTSRTQQGSGVCQ